MAEWEASQRGGGRRETEPWFYLEPRKDMYVGVPLDYKEEPALLEILDSPRLVQAAEAAMVPEEWDDGYVTCGLPGGRAVPVYPDEDGYCSWVRIMPALLLDGSRNAPPAVTWTSAHAASRSAAAWGVAAPAARHEGDVLLLRLRGGRGADVSNEPPECFDRPPDPLSKQGGLPAQPPASRGP